MVHVLNRPGLIANAKRTCDPREILVLLGVDVIFVERVLGRFVVGDFLRRAELHAGVFGVAVECRVAIHSGEITDEINHGVRLGRVNYLISSLFFDQRFAIGADPVDLAGDGSAVFVTLGGHKVLMLLFGIANVPQVVPFAAMIDAVPTDEDSAVMREFSARSLGDSFVSAGSHHVGEDLGGVERAFGT